MYDIGALGGYSVVRHEKLIQTVKNRQRLQLTNSKITEESESLMLKWTSYVPSSSLSRSIMNGKEYHDIYLKEVFQSNS